MTSVHMSVNLAISQPRTVADSDGACATASPTGRVKDRCQANDKFWTEGNRERMFGLTSVYSMPLPSPERVCEEIEGFKKPFGWRIMSGLGLRKLATLGSYYQSIKVNYNISNMSESDERLRCQKPTSNQSNESTRDPKSNRRSVTFALTEKYIQAHSPLEYDRKSTCVCPIRTQSEAGAVYVELMAFKMLEMVVHSESLENTARHLATPGSAEEYQWKCRVLKKILTPVNVKYKPNRTQDESDDS